MAHPGPDIWTDAVVIGGKYYQFTADPVRRDGTQLWTTSVGLAEYVANLELQGSSVELGCGLGLVGMVRNATLIDSDHITIANTRETLRLNDSPCRLVDASWDEIAEPFDNVFGSEILYPMYKPETVAEFLDRCWTGAGVCLFAVSDTRGVVPFEDRAKDLGLSCTREPANYRGFEYALIRVTGGQNA